MFTTKFLIIQAPVRYGTCNAGNKPVKLRKMCLLRNASVHTRLSLEFSIYRKEAPPLVF